MVILCDGCRSYIGGVVVNELLKQGHTIINYTRSKATPSKNPRYITVHGELDDMSRLITVMQENKVEAVLHLAAQSSPYVGFSVPLETAKVNFMDTMVILEAARLTGAERVVMFSSDCGAGSVGIDIPVTQDVHTKPRTVYGVTKTACEMLAGVYNYCYNMSCITLRIPHIIGEVRTPFEVFTEAMYAAVTGTKYVRDEGLDTPYAFLHLDSLTEAIIDSIMIPKEKVCKTPVYNVCDYNCTMKELLDCIKKYEPSFDYEVGPGYEHVNGIESEWIQGPWICDETTRDFGWKARYDLDSGVQAFLTAWRKAKEEDNLPEAAFISVN